MYNVIDQRLSHAALIVQGYGCPHLSAQFDFFFFFRGFERLVQPRDLSPFFLENVICSWSVVR